LHRRRRLATTFAALFLFLTCAWADAAAQISSDVSGNPFSPAPYRVGERLSYNVSFSNFPTAAHVELFVAGRGVFYGREGIEIRAHVETIGVVSAALYSINNDYVTYVDPANGFPYRVQQTIREGGGISDVARELNQLGGASAMPAAQATDIFPGSFDFISALYRLRALPLAQGASYGLTVQNGTVSYNAEVKVSGREMAKTNVGSSNTIATQVRVRGNASADAYRVRVNFTDDERHLPVIVTARHSSGEIRAELASAEIETETAPPSTGATPVMPSTPGIRLPPSAGIPARPPGRGATEGASVTPPTGPGVVGSIPELPFVVGEQLNFNFFLGGGAQPIGAASFQVRARAKYFNRDGLLLAAAMQTTGAGQRLFAVNDQINSYVDASTLFPFTTELNLQEGTRRDTLAVSLDQNSRSALFSDGTRVEMPVGTHDLVSVFYALRSFDLTPGKRNAVSLLVNKRPRLLFVTALRRASISLGGQQIPAVELSLVTNDTEGDRFSLRLWVSTDARRLPLRLTALTPLGPVRADLAIIPTQLQ
jgi:hypothetical protein